MATRGYLVQKRQRQLAALAAKRRQKRGGISAAQRDLVRTTAALLRDEINHRKIAPAHKARAAMAEREAGCPLFEGA